MTPKLETVCGGVAMRTPIMPASGTFSHEMEQVLDVGQLGALVLKTITRHHRAGNPVPRVSETARGMLNSIGLPGKGLKHFIEEELPKYRKYGSPIVASISADTAAEFGAMTEVLAGTGVAAFELNISCPNIEEDGQAFAMSPLSTAKAVAAARQVTALPIWAKLTPNTGRIADIAETAEAAGADAVVVANTLLGLSIDVESRRPTLGNVMGGLSGPAIKPIVLRMVYQCAHRVSIPVIGCGGISSGRDVVEYLLAGASAVQVGTESFLDPTALERIERELAEFCTERDVPDFACLIGALVDGDSSEGVATMDVSPT